MTEIPKLTADEATQLRYWNSASPTEDAFDKGLLAIMGMSFEPSLTDLGRAALAAFDAAERAKIRVEAMRECEEVAAEYAKRRGVIDEPYSVLDNLLEDIRDLIAKETP